MKARTCFRGGPRERYDRLTSRMAMMVNHEPVMKPDSLPDPKPKDLANRNALVLVEVEGGLVQNVSLLSQSAQPVLVLVRDYDNYKVDPDNYQDAEWLLG